MLQCFMFQSLMLQHRRVCQCQPGRSKGSQGSAASFAGNACQQTLLCQRMEVLLLCPFFLEEEKDRSSFPLSSYLWHKHVGDGGLSTSVQVCFPGGRCSLPCLKQLSLQWGGQSPDCCAWLWQHWRPLFPAALCFGPSSCFSCGMGQSIQKILLFAEEHVSI